MDQGYVAGTEGEIAQFDDFNQDWAQLDGTSGGRSKTYNLTLSSRDTSPGLPPVTHLKSQDVGLFLAFRKIKTTMACS